MKKIKKDTVQKSFTISSRSNGLLCEKALDLGVSQSVLTAHAVYKYLYGDQILNFEPENFRLFNKK